MAVGLGLKAAGLSIFGAGTGHAALGRWRRGAIWLGAVLVALLLTPFTIWGLLASTVLLFAAVVDAFVLGFRAKPDTQLGWLDKPAVITFAVAFTVATLLRLFVLETFKVPASSMYPTLEIGDHFVINKLASIEPGDVIVFRYPCDPVRDYVKRVIARGGDTVEVRCNIIWVNDKPIESKLVADGNTCTYNDYDERGANWFPRRCSRYHETLGSHSYDVFHDSERPARDSAPERIGDARDFPTESMTFSPSCSQSEEALGATGVNQVLGKIEQGESDKPPGPCTPQLHYVVPPGHVFVMGDNRNNSNDSRVWGGVPTSAIKGRVIGVWMSSRPGAGWFERTGAID